MKLKQYVVDAFTKQVFCGNPAAICILDHWLSDELMLNIACENNLSETAFAVKKDAGRYQLRWFTPGGEIDLCGHATLACSFVIMNYYDVKAETILFDTLSGSLTVVKRDALYEMDFPAYALRATAVTEELCDALGVAPKAAYMGRDLLCVLDDERQVRALSPDMEKIRKLEGLLLHVTAPGKEADCVSRSFAPKLNIAEDPVCGSGHCHIVPYWAGRLQKRSVVAHQASKRGGTLYCRMQGERVCLAGNAALYAVAEIYAPEKHDVAES